MRFTRKNGRRHSEDGMTPRDSFLRQHTPLTAATYEPVLRDLYRLVGRLEAATQDDIARYFDSIADQAPATVSRKLATLGSFYGYLRQRGLRQDDPMLAIGRRPKVDRVGSMRYITTEEQRRLIDGLQGQDQMTVRNLALIWTLLHGLRVSEVVGLDCEDFRAGELTFVGKGAKTRTVPLLLPAAAAMAAYLGRRKAGPLFRGREGRLHVAQVQRIVGELTLALTGSAYHPHALRHGFATRMVQAGVELPALQRLLGHASLSSTQIYVHLNTDDLRREMMKDPLAGPVGLTLIEGGKEKVG